jgi:uncharacterized protein
LTRWYLDTSAALKLLVEEPESAALARVLDDEQPELVACWLLETEMRRAANRERALTHEVVSDMLEGVSLYAMPASLFREAGLLAGESLRSLDALHLSAAVRIGVDRILTYDSRMAASARSLGMAVFAPA